MKIVRFDEIRDGQFFCVVDKADSFFDNDQLFLKIKNIGHLSCNECGKTWNSLIVHVSGFANVHFCDETKVTYNPDNDVTLSNLIVRKDKEWQNTK